MARRTNVRRAFAMGPLEDTSMKRQPSTILSHRIRLDPNNVQTTFLERCAGTARFAFNWGLARWQEQCASQEMGI